MHLPSLVGWISLWSLVNHVHVTASRGSLATGTTATSDGLTYLETREQLAAPFPDGFMILGAVFFIPVSQLKYPSQGHQLTPADRTQGKGLPCPHWDPLPTLGVAL